jgi:hypothetical protein
VVLSIAGIWLESADVSDNHGIVLNALGLTATSRRNGKNRSFPRHGNRKNGIAPKPCVILADFGDIW